MTTKTDPISWRELYQRTFDERDHAKLTQHVHLVEGALFDRWVELSQGDGNREELNEMNQAAQCLLNIKIDKLGWPPVFPRADNQGNGVLAA